MKSGLPQEGAVRLCYAESKDGITWHKPDLGLVSFHGSTANNIVAPLDERQSMQGATVYIDNHAPKEARYRLWSKFRPRDDEIKAGVRAGLWAMHSPDGLHWTYDEGQPNPPNQMCDTQNVFFWDDRIESYVGYTRVHETQHRDEAAEMQFSQRYRSVGRITSPDFRTWSQPTRIVLEGDALDLSSPLPPDSVDRPQIDFYTNAVFKHPEADDAYFMMPAAYHHWEADDSPATMEAATASSGTEWAIASHSSAEDSTMVPLVVWSWQTSGPCSPKPKPGSTMQAEAANTMQPHVTDPTPDCSAPSYAATALSLQMPTCQAANS